MLFRSVSIAALAFAGMCYLAGHAKFSEYLNLVYLPYSGELTVFCAAVVGAALGFLWYNCHPADVFMGDTGSLALGGALGTVAVLIKREMWLVVVGGVFVAEALSVMIQVASFKLWGRRVFRMSPLHHHFEQAGGGLAGPGGADDQGPPAGERMVGVDGHCSLKVDSPSRASRAPQM